MYRKTLPNLIHSIEEYKWLESEKAGYDIGENEASKRWIKSYYREWFLQHVS
jgi:hypothetical protein